MMCGASGLGIACGGALSLDGVARISDLQSNATLGGSRKMSTMKKLVTFGAAALCATVGFSAVTSANVVGYQNKAAEVSGYTWVANTFEKVDGSVTKLSDLAFEPAPAPTAVKLYLLSKSGATEEIDGKKQIFIYVGPAKCTKNNGWIPG